MKSFIVVTLFVFYLIMFLSFFISMYPFGTFAAVVVLVSHLILDHLDKPVDPWEIIKSHNKGFYNE